VPLQTKIRGRTTKSFTEACARRFGAPGSRCRSAQTLRTDSLGHDAARRNFGAARAWRRSVPLTSWVVSEQPVFDRQAIGLNRALIAERTGEPSCVN